MALLPGSPIKRTLALASALGAVLFLGGAFVEVMQVRARTAKMAATAKLPERPPVWSLPVLTYLRSIPAHVTAVKDLAFTPDGTQLLTASFDYTVKVWDARTGQAIRALPGHTGRVAAVRVTRDGQYAVTAGDTTIRVWSLRDGKPLRTVTADPKQVYAMDVSPNGQTLVSGSGDGRARVWTIEGSAIATLEHGVGRVLSAAFSPDGTRIATAGDDRTIKVWGASDWTLLQTFEGHAGAINQAIFAPDGQLIASASDDHTIKLWHPSSKPLATLSQHRGEVWALAFSPDGANLVSGGDDATINVWAPITATLRQKWPLDATRKTLAVAFAPDGITFAAANGNGTVDLWRVAKSGTHLPLPVPEIVPRQIAPNTTPEQRAYADAMDLMDRYEGDRTMLDRAEAELKAIQKSNPSSALAYCGLGRVAYKRGFVRTHHYEPAQLTIALDLASRAIAIDPTLADAYVVRGWASLESKDVAGARTSVATALKLAPTMPRAMALAAELAMDNGDVDGAERILRDMLSRPVDRYFASLGFSALADVFWQLRDFEASEQAWRRDIDVEPESASAKGNFANFLIQKGDYEGAIAMAKQALSQMLYGAAKRSLADAFCFKGEHLLWDRGDAEEAASAFGDANNADPGDARAAYDLGAYHQYLGVTRHESKHAAQAKDWYARAAALDSKDELPKKVLMANQIRAKMTTQATLVTQ